MKKLNLSDVKTVLDYISEPIIISDMYGKIIDCNAAAQKRLYITKEDITNKNFMDFIPEDEAWKVNQSIQNESDDYYEIILKRLNGDMFPALVSGKQFMLNESRLRLSTILDMTKLKKKEVELIAKSSDQLKRLKSHVITKISSTNQEKNKIKSDLICDIANYKNKIKKYKRKSDTQELLVSAMKKQLINMELKNTHLQQKVNSMENNNLSIEYIINAEIATANSKEYNLSLAMIGIENYKQLQTFFHKSEPKLDILISATLRLFKQNIRSIDIAQYIEDGIYYIIFPNIEHEEVLEIVKELSQKKKIHDCTVFYKYGIAHLFEEDDAQRILKRCLQDFSKY